MTRVTEEMDELRAAMIGTVIGPGDPAYDKARALWNAAVDGRPVAVARCADAADVRTAIAFAQRNGLEISVRGGAHDPAGAAVADGGLMIDLSGIDAVAVDPRTRRVRVGGGATLAQLDGATQEHGLAVPAGVVSRLGVGGLTLGGGTGWLTRRAGLTIDNLASAQVMTADGRFLRAAADENPDLYWGVRGGGGNYGVVTEFEFLLHEVGPIVQLGMLFFGPDRLTDVLRAARDLTPSLSREFNVMIAGMTAPSAPFVPDEHQLQPVCGLLVTGFGTPRAHAAVLAGFRAAVPPLFDTASPIPYVELQRMFDESAAWGFHSYERGTSIADLTDDVIDVIADHLPRRRSPLSSLLIYRLDQAFSDVPDDDTAFSGTRAPHYRAFIMGLVPVPEMFEREREWVRAFWAALQPHAGAGYGDGTVGFGDDTVRTAYGAKYDRLAATKAAYDPDNVFRHNANIRPTSR